MVQYAWSVKIFFYIFNKNYNWKSAKALKQVGKKYTFYSEGLLRLLLIIKLLTSSPQSKIQFLQALHEVGRVSELGHLKLAHVSWSADCQDSVSRNQLTSAYVSQGVHVWADDWNLFYLGRALFWSLFLSSIVHVWPKRWHFWGTWRHYGSQKSKIYGSFRQRSIWYGWVRAPCYFGGFVQIWPENGTLRH